MDKRRKNNNLFSLINKINSFYNFSKLLKKFYYKNFDKPKNIK